MSSAFLVLHYQNSVAHPNGIWGSELFSQISKDETYTNAKHALETARRAGLLVVYVNVAFRPNAPEVPQDLFGIVAHARSSDQCLAGSWGTQPIEELAPLEGEVQLDNFNSDAFQGTALDQILRAQGVTKIYLIGQVIEHMVGTSMKRAANSGYKAVLLADCVGGYSDVTREAMLDILQGYGRISTSTEFATEMK
ncbi:cysteine hydrolase family protein [Ruegeria arenilitoris]|uniref:cysteine hydrolase family protein n=1 Tax=Ruegeria arenilitoris TaxID=1173585 RepID=UPI00147B98D5|nr:cysteine hydrolase [Ruegeria arenilitoris]